MSRAPFKVGIIGTHSTGKTTFLNNLEASLKSSGLTVERIERVAVRAQELGFPILTEHTFESTLWVMAEILKQEAEKSLCCDVILVDRAILDALAYLRAALQISRRTLDAGRVEELTEIARAHAKNYDVLIATLMDDTKAVADGRNKDAHFRKLVAQWTENIVSEFSPNALRLSSTNSSDILAKTTETIFSHFEGRFP
jgi:predicted ATPase